MTTSVPADFYKLENVQVIRSDGSSIYQAAETWEDIVKNEDLIQALYDNNFDSPSAIQAKSIPIILAEPPRDAIIRGQNGTGKTLAFVISLLCKVDISNPATQGICLVPSRELAIQTGEVLAKLTQRYHVSFQIFCPGSNIDPSKPAQILVCSPQLFNKKNLVNFSNVKLFIVDEADFVFANKDTPKNFEMLMKTNIDRTKCQIAFFSATLDDRIQKLIRGAFPPNFIKEETTIPESIKFFYIECEDTEREECIMEMFMYLQLRQTIIFVNKQTDCRYLQEFLEHRGYSTQIFNQSLEDNDRKKMMSDFNNGLIRILIATDILHRGIDVQQLQLVINYSFPVISDHFQYDTYKHRVARVGRFGREGLCIQFIVTDEDRAILKELQTKYNVKFTNIRRSQLKDLEQFAEANAPVEAAKPSTENAQ